MNASYGWDWGPFGCRLVYGAPSASTRTISGSEKLEPRLDLSFELAGDEFAGTVQVSVRGPSKVSIKEVEAKDLPPIPSVTMKLYCGTLLDMESTPCTKSRSPQSTT